LAEYKDHALAVIGAINRELINDQDFANAAKAVKWCGDVETRLEAVKQHALSQTETIDLLFKTIDDIKAKARETRLDLDKLVTRRNTERKEEIILGGKQAYQVHLASLKAETEGLWVDLPTPDFAGSIKGMRLFANMQDAVNTLLANSKITADDSAKKIRGNLALLADANEHAFLFNDRGILISKAADDLRLLIKSRISEHQAAEERKAEQLRESIRKEEQDKLAAEQADLDRVTAERASAEAIAKAQPEQPAIEAVAPAKPDMVRFGSILIPREQIDKTWPAKPAPVTPPDLKLGQIAERLGFALTADFLKSLGFEPAATDKSAKLYHSKDFPAICRALIEHIESVCEMQEA
jgi:hypothetical protein